MLVFFFENLKLIIFLIKMSQNIVTLLRPTLDLFNFK
ncbi:MAG: hypothetical protein ACI843_002715 [Psychrobacter glaciei]|jgi:hypothetical protein